MPPGNVAQLGQPSRGVNVGAPLTPARPSGGLPAREKPFDKRIFLILLYFDERCPPCAPLDCDLDLRHVNMNMPCQVETMESVMEGFLFYFLFGCGKICFALWKELERKRKQEKATEIKRKEGKLR